MIRRFFTFCLVILSSGLVAQNVGDTIVVQSLHHGSATRDTVVEFPGNPSLTFEKILLKYNMRCTDGKVSTGTNRNLGCGEWDYSCNTYIHDSSRVDSLLSNQISFSISDFSGDTFNYSSGPVNTYYVNYQTKVNVDSIISENQSTVGTGTNLRSEVIATDNESGKSMYLFKSAELSTAGVSTGNIDGILLSSASASSSADFLRIRIKATTDSVLDPSSPHLNGFTEVYFTNTQLASGSNRLQFHTPFNWNGTSNLILELTFTNSQTAAQTDILGDSLNSVMGLNSSGDKYFNFNSSNYIEANNYKGIGGSNDRTVEAWIKTTVANKEIVSWGRDAGSQKWNFRLDGSGRPRVEVNGGYKVGSTDLRDNEWHHVAVTFSGVSVIQCDLYVDGVLESTSAQSGTGVNTDTVNGINVRVSRGTNNRYFEGIIDEVRVWNAKLTVNELADWMHRSINSDHPKYANLQLYYPMNEGIGTAVADESGNQRDATMINGNQWSKISGLDHFKGMDGSHHRPNVVFLQGTYQTTSVVDTVYDTIQNLQHTVTAYQIYPNPGTIKSDSIASTTGFYWQAGYEYVIDTNGAKIDSFLIGTAGQFVIQNLPYLRRYPMRFEIMSFVTPYGIGLDMGDDGETWTFDLTDFSPVLRGNKRLTMEWGGQWQEEMDIQFLFIVGTPPRDVLDIQQIWRVTKPSYQSIEANSAYEPRDFPLLSSGKYFKIRSAITGHGQQGEFIARNHRLSLNSGSNNYTWQVWKECPENPVFPQGGTWIYDRAGWCPGMATDLKETNVTNVVTAGSNVDIDYTVISATGSSSYIVNHQMVTYDDINHSLDAAIVDIKAPTSAIEYARTNYVCSNPTVVIRNNGSTDLTSAEIEYWLNDAATPLTHSWEGDLKFGETEEVILTSDNAFWEEMHPSDNKFHVKITDPNGGSDDYTHNDHMSSDFEIPDVVPSEFVVYFRTNSAGYENTYFILDEEGRTVLSRTNLQSNTVYTDTMNLDPGCYQYYVIDADGDGIDFWANQDGAGTTRFITTDNKLVTNFEPDFGASIIYNFTIDFPLSYEEIEDIRNDVFRVYPNPAQGQFTVEASRLDESQVLLFNSSGQQVNAPFERNGDLLVFQTALLSKGIYFVQLRRGDEVRSEKLIVQ